MSARTPTAQPLARPAAGKAATINDIARLAGVSKKTVSRIINGKGEASPETVKRVLKLVAEHNYQPNQLARTLSQRSSNLLAVMLPNLMNPFFGELATAIERVANRGKAR